MKRATVDFARQAANAKKMRAYQVIISLIVLYLETSYDATVVINIT